MLQRIFYRRATINLIELVFTLTAKASDYEALGSVSCHGHGSHFVFMPASGSAVS